MADKSKKYIQSIERAAAVLRCFVEHDELGLTEISNMIGLHKSTAAGIVNTLKNEKFLEQNPRNSKFKLGIELFRLGANIKIDLKKICAPYLQRILNATDETVNLVTFDGSDVIFIEKRESPHSMRICTSIGKRLPMYCTATGKAILANLPSDEAEHIIENMQMVRFTANTLPNKELLREQLEEIRTRKYSFDLEELEDGLVCIGSAIIDRSGRPVGGISVSGPSIRMTETKMNEIKNTLIDIVDEISHEF